ncbi:MAG: Type 1 glutamine amidotransferase-like domain-containing protein [Proteobacteria bacterium]|nr:Type 1 glutamine amidotransferase-like domain-containing protein [Pseudomonadota bacterium]
MAVQIMLGPQSPRANLKNAIDSLSFNGPIVTITAGWRDSEAETDELQAEIGIPIEDLNLYHQAEKIFALEPELRALQRERQGKLLELQRLYRIRLTPTMAAARKLLREKGEPDLLRLEQRAAISQVRALDRHHVRRISAIHQDFDTRRAALLIPGAATLRQTIQRKVADSALVLIAGGHVAVLINRIRLFRLADELAQKPIIAWSAGAMVLGERIVLFHDDAPQGKRDAEVLDTGLGIVKNIIPLPHAKSRLDWSSRTRMALFSRRFAPAICCTLDNGSMIQMENNRITSASHSSVIMRTGWKKSVKAQ